MSERNLKLRIIDKSSASIDVIIGESLGLLESPTDKPKPFHGVMRVMTPQDGDKRVTWDSRDFTQIREAKEMFDKCVAEGLVPYCVDTLGKASPQVMTDFDPHAEEVIFLPIRQVVGG